METEEIVNHFAGLVGKTMSALIDKGVTIDALIAVIEHSYTRNGNKLIDQLEVTLISKVFRVLHQFWSFFDYKILGVIITSFCCDFLKLDFDKYVATFKEYCHHRVCDAVAEPEV